MLVYCSTDDNGCDVIACTSSAICIVGVPKAPIMAIELANMVARTVMVQFYSAFAELLVSIGGAFNVSA